MAYMKDNEVWKTVDWWTIVLYLVLIFCGWVSVCGASYDYGEPDFLDFSSRAGRQLMWMGCSLGLGFILLMLEDRLYDCGTLVFDLKNQDVHAGGSGCGCSAITLCSYLLKELSGGKLKKILFCGTGALLSPTSTQQGLPIPGVCHAVAIEGGVS